MSGIRPPHVAGVAGGVGTSLVVAALRGIDDGVYLGGDVDILVCQTTASSLGLAHEAIGRASKPPVLAVVADIPASAPASVRARVKMASAHVEAIVHIPFVPGLRHLVDPYAAARMVLCPGVALPKAVRPFASAMHRLAAAVTPLVTSGFTSTQLAPGGAKSLAHTSLPRPRSMWPIAQ